MVIDNSDKAWASVLKLRLRSQILLAVFIISFVIGVLLVVTSVGTIYTDFGYSSAESAIITLTIGILLISLASSSSIGWFFAVSMANQSEVVYFSSASNKERVELEIPDNYGELANANSTSSTKKITAGVVQTAAIKCSDCGAKNDDDMTYCRVCGGYLN